MEEPTNSKPNLLRGLRVGLSCTVPGQENWGDIPDLDRVILTYVAQFSSLVLQYGGQIVHSSTRAFTPVLAEQARAHGNQDSSKLRLYASELYGTQPEATRAWAKTGEALLKMTPKVGSGGEEDEATRNDSLTALRMAIMGDIDVMVAVGVMVRPDADGHPSGLEIVTQARWRDIPCFLVGAFGISNNTFGATMLQLYNKGNLLESEEIAYFAAPSLYMTEGVGKLVLHLIKHRDEFAKPLPVATAAADGSENIQEPQTAAPTQAYGRVQAQAETTQAVSATRILGRPNIRYLLQPEEERSCNATLLAPPTATTAAPVPRHPVPSADPEVVHIDPEEVRQASKRLSELCSALTEDTVDSAAQLLERPDFLS